MWLPEEADIPGKLELVPVEGQTVTGPHPLSPPDTCHTDRPEKERATKSSTQTNNKVTENQRHRQSNKTTNAPTHDLQQKWTLS